MNNIKEKFTEIAKKHHLQHYGDLEPAIEEMIICVKEIIKSQKTNNMNEFPKIWFESNLYFGWVNDLDDLKSVFEQYKGHLTRDEILDKAVNKDDTLTEFGLRIEHCGNVTLRQFLTDKGVLTTEG